jgi:hypothetical protein|nr:MAG TPA: hypothetical protein [Caudoviricetes sp.]
MAIKKNKKPLLAKFTEGNSVGSAEVSSFSDWTLIYYVRDSLSGSFNKEIYGIEGDFDLIVMFESNAITKQISNDTIFLINEYPTSMNKEGNYVVEKIISHDDGEIIVGLSKRSAVNLKNIYYSKNGEIFSYQMNFDNDTLKGYVNKYLKVPFAVGDIVWLYEPDSAEDTENRIQLNEITNIGIIDNLKIFTEYSFGEYND